MLSAQYIPKGRAVRGMSVLGTKPNVHFSNAIYWETSWLTELNTMWNRYQLSSSSNTYAVGTSFLIFFLQSISPHNHLLPSGIAPFPRTSAEPGSGCIPRALRACHRQCASMHRNLTWGRLDTDSEGRSYLSLKLINFCMYLKSFTSTV